MHWSKEQNPPESLQTKLCTEFLSNLTGEDFDTFYFCYPLCLNTQKLRTEVNIQVVFLMR